MMRRALTQELARGAVLVVFGLLLFMLPGNFFSVLLVLFGIAALVDGVLALASLRRGADALERPRWALAFEGMAGLAAGGITLFTPDITALVLVSIVAVWAIATGGAELAAAAKLERSSSLKGARMLRGVLLIALGCLLLMRPMTGSGSLLSLIGLFSIAVGATTIGSTIMARRLGRRAS
jgi:uncharacterized membrane protein HdeD (DUF308 family)